MNTPNSMAQQMPKIFLLFLICAFMLTVCSSCTERKPPASFRVSTTTDRPPDTAGWPRSFGLGKPATEADIAALDIDVRPDGKGLPEGTGSPAAGRSVYVSKCAACHGATGREGPQAPLVGIPGDTTRARTIGNYWPYATTLFDYIRRAMPYNAPGSLSNEEVYHLTAYLLSANKIIDSTGTINATTLARVRMPAQPFFIPDDRRGGAEVR